MKRPSFTERVRKDVVLDIRIRANREGATGHRTGMGPPDHKATESMITQLTLNFPPLAIPRLISPTTTRNVAPKTIYSWRESGGILVTRELLGGEPIVEGCGRSTRCALGHFERRRRRCARSRQRTARWDILTRSRDDPTLAATGRRDQISRVHTPMRPGERQPTNSPVPHSESWQESFLVGECAKDHKGAQWRPRK